MAVLRERGDMDVLMEREYMAILRKGRHCYTEGNGECLY